MSLLQYTSSEMYSSTELIRKSKTIYDKLNNKEIEKAIILRDGKPSFMLLDFETYERIMNEYLEMKGLSSISEVKNPLEAKKEVMSSVKVEKELVAPRSKKEVTKPQNMGPKKARKSLSVNQDALKEVLNNTEKHQVPPKENNGIRQKLKEFWD